MEQLIISTYIAGETSLRDVAGICGTNHHTVKRVLIKNNISIVKAKRKPFSEEHKRNISQATKGRESWLKGKKATTETIYKNMAAHLRFDVTWQWLSQFDDIEKLKFLNASLTNRDKRWDESSEWYIAYIERFYFDNQFNLLYDRWNKSGCKPYMKPSIDHITPKAKGGTNALDNLQFLTWFENRCKNDMSQEDWDKMKSNILEYFV